MNAQINEDYVNFETAKLLKEKGYKGSFNDYYNNVGCVVDKPNPILKEPKYQYYERVSLYMAMKWLREVHHIHIEVHLDSMDGRHPIYEALYSECVTIRTDNFIDYGDTYEQACEVAIKYCLENLI